MTREALGLADVEGRQFPAAEDLTAQDIVDNKTTLDNVRLWDPEIVKQSFGQLQTIRPYYEFADVDVDRYTINGQKRQVLVSAREMNSLAARRAGADVGQPPPGLHAWLRAGHEPGNRVRLARTAAFHHRRHPARCRKHRRFGLTRSEVKEPRIYFGEDTPRLRGRRHDASGVRLPDGREERHVPVQGQRGVQVGSLAQASGMGDTTGFEPDPVLGVHQAQEPRPDEARSRDANPGAGAVAHPRGRSVPGAGRRSGSCG